MSINLPSKSARQDTYHVTNGGSNLHSFFGVEGRKVSVGCGDLIHVSCGLVGATGKNGAGTSDEIKQIVTDTIHANATNDGILVDGSGNIRMAIGELQSMP